MSNLRCFVVCSVVLMAYGCAKVPIETPKNDLNYTPPKKYTIKNKEVINDKFEKVWNRLISNLSEKYFVINNVEKASRIINVSFSTSEPSNFIDCGDSLRTIEFKESGKLEEFRYEVSRNGATYKLMRPVGRVIITWIAERATSLQGRINIYVAPKFEKTEITVKTRYIFKAVATFSSTATGRIETKTTPDVIFNTNGTGKFKFLRCRSMGVIERDIMEAAKTD